MTITEKKTYNGWTNYETWVVKLWLDNEQSSYNFWREETKKSSVYDLSKTLQRLHEVDCETTFDTISFKNDLLNGALSEVNWREIAEHLKEEE